MSRDQGPFNIQPTQRKSEFVLLLVMWVAFTFALASLAMAAGYFFN